MVNEKPKSAASGHAQQDGHGEGHENRGEGPARPVEEEVQDHDEEAEEGKVAVAGFPRLPLEVGRDEGLAEAADPAKGGARGRDRRLDPGQGRVALLGGMDVEAQGEAQEVVSEQGLAPEEGRAGQESAESGRAVGAHGDAGPEALRERKGADRGDPGHPREGLLERAQGGQGRGMEGIVGLREKQDGGRLGEDALERAGRGVVLVRRDDHPLDGVVGGDAKGEEARDGNEEGVAKDDALSPPQDPAEEGGQSWRGRRRFGQAAAGYPRTGRDGTISACARRLRVSPPSFWPSLLSPPPTSR